MTRVAPLPPGRGVQPYAFHRPPSTYSMDRRARLYVPPKPSIWAEINRMLAEMSATGWVLMVAGVGGFLGFIYAMWRFL